MDLPTKSVVTDFSAGYVTLDMVDATEEKALINQVETLTNIPREPDVRFCCKHVDDYLIDSLRIDLL